MNQPYTMCHSVILAPLTSRAHQEPAAFNAWLSRTQLRLSACGLSDSVKSEQDSAQSQDAGELVGNESILPRPSCPTFVNVSCETCTPADYPFRFPFACRPTRRLCIEGNQEATSHNWGPQGLGCGVVWERGCLEAGLGEWVPKAVRSGRPARGVPLWMGGRGNSAWEGRAAVWEQRVSGKFVHDYRFTKSGQSTGQVATRPLVTRLQDCSVQGGGGLAQGLGTGGGG